MVHIVCRSRRSPLDRDDPGGPGPRRRGRRGVGSCRLSADCNAPPTFSNPAVSGETTFVSTRSPAGARLSAGGRPASRPATTLVPHAGSRRSSAESRTGLR
ncbi:hypothetical protein HMPREF9057_02277 [Actinomyces sp. oral taxon 171 str. F0337]|nr:hypothetical protein HMPREF9057_02277 [Actinomyces sp. oral taxon 171 str. F0337]